MFAHAFVAQVQAFTDSLPIWLQWLAVVVIAAIPLLESHFGALVGVLAGLPLPVAVAVAVVGNAASMTAVVLATDAIRSRVRRRAAATTSVADPQAAAESRSKARVRRVFNRYGVAGVGLVGQMIVPNQINSAMLVSFGAPRNRVIAWQLMGICLWGCVFAALAAGGVHLIG